jgi:ABC-2 type transport system permease protein
VQVLRSVIVKEFLQLLRDRRMLPLVLVAPILELIIFGYAANTDVNHLSLVLVDQDRSAESRALLDRFLGSGYFDLAGTEEDVDRVEPWLVSGRAQVALVISPDYSRAVERGEPPEIQIIADGSDANSAGIGLGYASGIVSAVGSDLLRERLRAAAPPGTEISPERIVLKPRVWYNPSLKARWFYVPAVLAMVLMLITMMLSSMGIVREKEIGTMEQIIVTPIRSWQLIIGKLFPFLAIGIGDLILVTALAVGYFHLPLRGSPLLLFVLSLLFMMCTLGLGLFMSTLVRTQQQAMISSIFLLMVPMLYLSGLIFPIDNMPRVIQIATYGIPLRYYATIIRGIFLKGSGLDTLWPEALALLAMGVTLLTLASLRFRKRLD